MLPKIGIRIELANGLWVTVKQHNPNGYSPDKPQEFVGKDDKGELYVLQSKDIHSRYFR